MKAFLRRVSHLHPTKALILGYISLTVLGFINLFKIFEDDQKAIDTF